MDQIDGLTISLLGISFQPYIPHTTTYKLYNNVINTNIFNRNNSPDVALSGEPQITFITSP